MNFTNPNPTGEYAVGTKTFSIKDPGEGLRSIASRLYYPVDKEHVEGLEKAEYMSRDMAKAIKKTLKIPVNYDKITAEGKNISECYPDAPKIESKKFPLIVFTHGCPSYREANSFLCIDLASHGYVVMVVSHAPDAMLTELDDGTKIPTDNKMVKEVYKPFLPAVLKLTKIVKMKGSNQEIADTFDEFQFKYCKVPLEVIEKWKKETLVALEYAKKNYSDLIDFEKGVGAAGHSLGGDASYALCCESPEFVCGINIDGAPFGDFRNAVLDKPFLQISCKDNEIVVARIYIRHTKKVYKVLFDKMQHLGFSDMKFMSPIMVGKLSPDVLHENLCRCHLEFFDAYLAGRKDSPNLTSNESITVSEFEPDM